VAGTAAVTAEGPRIVTSAPVRRPPPGAAARRHGRCVLAARSGVIWGRGG